MAPLAQTPHHTSPISSILTTNFLRKRDTSCTYYDASCGMHHLVITGIIIFVAVLISGITLLLCVRSQRSKALKLRAARTKSTDVLTTWQPATVRIRMYDGAPPPYTPRRPERAARVGEWR
jgi:hypothetical protein